jgi:CRP-like cAMP-binding protein
MLKVLDLATARETISKRGWLATRPEGFIQQFLSLTTLRLLKKSEFAHHLGDGHGSFYGIVEGGLLVLVPFASKGLQYGHLSRSGEWFGVAPALTMNDRQVTLEAATDTVLLTIQAAALQDLFARSPETSKHILALVLSNQLVTIRSGADLLIRNPRARLAARLLTLSGLRLNQTAEHKPCDLPLTQDQLAAMSCLSRNSVNRILSEFALATSLPWRAFWMRRSLVS